MKEPHITNFDLHLSGAGLFLSIIESVCFMYTGNDKQFNSFLKSVIRDYLADDTPAVEILTAKEEIKKNAEEKSA